MCTRSGSGHTRPDPVPSEVIGERRALINIAYRMLGSLAEAEDAVQETYARWYAMTRPQQQAIQSPGAWLRKVTGRVCLDMLGSARVRRERYLGQWLPEPLPDHTAWIGKPEQAIEDDPADRVTLDESVSMAFLVVLDSMTPAERVAFVLHDVFSYSFADVAEIVGRSPAACRKLASSARHRIDRSRAPAGPSAHEADVVRDFKQAWEAKNIDALIQLLDPDVIMTADGGGLAKTALRPIEGCEQVVRYALGIADKVADLTILERNVNGQPGLVVLQAGATVTVVAFAVTGSRITHVWAVRNPEKLRSWPTGQVPPTDTRRGHRR
jgi:RNA polymerase sigma factor (sigma-70 family)